VDPPPKTLPERGLLELRVLDSLYLTFGSLSCLRQVKGFHVYPSGLLFCQVFFHLMLFGDVLTIESQRR
jgi:hypothetical protein